jgi:hypothetical protein
MRYVKIWKKISSKAIKQSTSLSRILETIYAKKQKIRLIATSF